MSAGRLLTDREIEANLSSLATAGPRSLERLVRDLLMDRKARISQHRAELRRVIEPLRAQLIEAHCEAAERDMGFVQRVFGRRRLSDLTAQLATMSNRLVDASVAHRRTESELQGAKASAESLARQAAGYQRDAEQATTEAQRVRAELEGAHRSAREKESQLAELHQQHSALQSTLSEARSEIDALHATNKDLGAHLGTVDGLETRLQESQALLDEANRYIEQYQAREKELQLDNDMLRDELDAIQGEQSEVDSLNEQIRQLRLQFEKQLASRTQERDAAQQELHLLRQAHTEALAQAETRSGNRSDLVAAIKAAIKDRRQLREDLKEAMLANRDLHHRNQGLTSDNAQLRDAQEQAAAQRTKDRQIMEVQDERIQQLEARLAEKTQAIERMEGALADRQRENDALQVQSQQAMAELNVQRERNQRAIARADALSQTLRTKVTELQEQQSANEVLRSENIDQSKHLLSIRDLLLESLDPANQTPWETAYAPQEIERMAEAVKTRVGVLVTSAGPRRDTPAESRGAGNGVVALFPAPTPGSAS